MRFYSKRNKISVYKIYHEQKLFFEELYGATYIKCFLHMQEGKWDF